MFERFRRDFARCLALDSDGPSLGNRVRILLNTPQLHALAVYRFGHWVNTRVDARPVRVPLFAVYHVLDRAVQVLWGMHIDSGADIGGGLYIGHPGFLLIGPVKMGEDCCVGPNTLIGQRSDGVHGRQVPTIGDRVWIGAGSVIHGGSPLARAQPSVR